MGGLKIYIDNSTQKERNKTRLARILVLINSVVVPNERRREKRVHK